MDKDFAKQSAVMKLEAMALFAAIKAQAQTQRWWFFSQMRNCGRAVRFEQSVSSYRASLHFDYIFCGIDCQIYIEREVHSSLTSASAWTLSFSGIEGKDHALTIQNALKPLQDEGYDIPNGNENLERQMNFSLGLYGSCLMHVDVKFPPHQSPQLAALRVLDLIDSVNRTGTPSLDDVLRNLDLLRAASINSDDDNPDIIMGDWQTWK